MLKHQLKFCHRWKIEYRLLTQRGPLLENSIYIDNEHASMKRFQKHLEVCFFLFKKCFVFEKKINSCEALWTEYS